MKRLPRALALGVFASALSQGAARADDAVPAPRVLELSRLWVDPPDPSTRIYPYAGNARAHLRGWDDGRFQYRPGLEIVPGGYLAPTRLLEEGTPELRLHLSNEFAAGPMFASNVDAGDLMARYPTTIPQQLVGGKRSLYNEARASLSNSFAGDRVTVRAEAIDLRTEQTYLGSTVSEKEARPRYTLNLAWQPSAYTHVSVGGRYDGIATSDYGLGYWTFPSAGTRRQIDDTTLVVHVRHQLSPRNEIEATYDVVYGRKDTKPLHGVETPGHYNLDTFQSFANAPFYVRSRALTQRLDAHWSTFLDGVFVPGDAHTITLGAQAELTSRDDDDSRTGGFTFVDISSAPSGAPIPSSINPNDRSTWNMFSSDRGDELHAKTKSSSLGAYLEDRIAFGSSFRITPGVRYEHFDGAFRGGPTVWRTDTVSPRVGAVWDIDLYTTFFGDAGRHYQALDASMFLRAAAGAAYSPLEYHDWQGAAQVPADPARNDPAWARTTSFPAEMGALSKVKHPYVDRIAVGIVRTIEALRTRLRLRYEARRYGDMLALVDVGGAYNDATFQVANSPAPKDTASIKALAPGSSQTYAVINPSDAERTLHTVSLAVVTDVGRDVTLRGAVTFTSDRGNLDAGSGISTEWRDPNGKLRSYGNVPGFDSWVARLGATVDLPLRVRMFADYTFRSGEYYSRVFRVTKAAANQPRFFVYDVDGRGSRQLPSRHLVDLGASRDIASFGGGRLSAWVQTYNLLNMSTVTSVSEKSTYFNSVKALEQPREIHVGVRYDL